STPRSSLRAGTRIETDGRSPSGAFDWGSRGRTARFTIRKRSEMPAAAAEKRSTAWNAALTRLPRSRAEQAGEARAPRRRHPQPVARGRREVAEPAPDAQIDVAADRLPCGQHRDVFPRVVGRDVRRLAAMVGGQQEQIVIAHGGQDFRQKAVEGGEV